MMNKREIGKAFEKEAYNILKGIFEKVEWLSEKKSSTFDFKITHLGKDYYGDAKVIKRGKPILRKAQHSANFIITTDGEEVKLIFGMALLYNAHYDFSDTKSIKLRKETILRLRSYKLIDRETDDELVNRLLDQKEKKEW